MSIGVRKGPQWMNCCCSQEGNVYEVNNLYETSFPKLTDQFFKVRSDKNTPGKCGNWYIWHFTSRKTQGKIIQFSSKLFSQGVTMARSRGRGPLCQWWPHLPQPLQVPFHWGLHHLKNVSQGAVLPPHLRSSPGYHHLALYFNSPQHAPTLTQPSDPMNWSPCTVAIQEQGSLLLPLCQTTI